MVMVQNRDLSFLSYKTNKIKRMIKESLLLFSRDKPILIKQVRLILCGLF